MYLIQCTFICVQLLCMHLLVTFHMIRQSLTMLLIYMTFPELHAYVASCNIMILHNSSKILLIWIYYHQILPCNLNKLGAWLNVQKIVQMDLCAKCFGFAQNKYTKAERFQMQMDQQIGIVPDWVPHGILSLVKHDFTFFPCIHTLFSI